MIIPSPEVETIYGFPVVGCTVLFEQGSFRRVRYWIKGHHKILGQSVHFLMGLSGPETQLDVEQIFPIGVIEVH